ncbi:MAG TPA: YceD family protein [Rhodocyclaceae bacterium]|nr:YceD family protein [Rhodocyclaceae bacterium]
MADNALPAAIDSLAFSSDGRALAGRVAVAALPRLQDSLADSDGWLRYEVRGTRDRDGKSWLSVRVVGQVNVVCQRCLAKLEFPVDVRSRLLLVPPGRPWPDESDEDEFDAIAAEQELALLPLIEDEVLLALPIAPRHEFCAVQGPTVAEHEPSPFAVLAKLKKGV